MEKDFQTLLKTIAEKNNTTPEEVYREMAESIDLAFDNPDPAVQQAWVNIPYKGDRPTTEEVIIALANRVKESM